MGGLGDECRRHSSPRLPIKGRAAGAQQHAHGIPLYGSCPERRRRTSSGRQRGNRPQEGQREAASLPVSGGGGVSREATWNACTMAALVLARTCGVKGTSTRRRDAT